MRAAPRLDARLRAVAKLVAPGARVADVGCDHGKLAVALAASGRAAKVIAIDLRPQPLARAQRLVQETGCDQLVECRLGDGLSCVAPGEVDTVVLAGISGITICQILAAAPWVRSPAVRLVAMPANKPEVLRYFLAREGFTWEVEVAALAAGRPYLALAVHYAGRPFAPTPLFCWLGLLGQKGGDDPATLSWRRHQLHRLFNTGQVVGGGYVAAEAERCLDTQPRPTGTGTTSTFYPAADFPAGLVAADAEAAELTLQTSGDTPARQQALAQLIEEVRPLCKV